MSKINVRIQSENFTDFEVEYRGVDESVKDALIQAVVDVLQKTAHTNRLERED